MRGGMEGTSTAAEASEADVFEAVVLVTRGEYLPKKNGTKTHPTYEVSERVQLLSSLSSVACPQ